MNSINARVDFSFKGKHYTPEITIELDQFIQQKEPVSLHRLIAKQHEIDCYSYLYEVMESSDIFYYNPQGLAIAHTTDEYFDIDSYKAQWAVDNLLKQLLLIAKKEMNIADFEQNPSLKNALLQAYNLGYSQLK